jgi:hypothetical protein
MRRPSKAAGESKHKMKPNEYLQSIGACREAVQWVEEGNFETLDAAWQACQRGDWMLWLAGKTCGPVNTPGHRLMTSAKCRCARLVLHLFEDKYPDDNRPRLAIESAERYSVGDGYDPKPADAAYAAAYAADAAYSAAYADAAAYAADAAYAAAYADAAAYAADAADAAAYAADAAAAYAAYAADAAYAAAYAADAAAAYAADAARTKMLARCADEVRIVYPKCPINP